MVATLSRHCLSVHSSQTNPKSTVKCQSVFFRSPNCSDRLRSVPRLSSRNDHTTSTESPSHESEPKTTTESEDSSNPKNPPPDSSLFESIVPRFRRFRDGVLFDELGSNILSIALPAALALAADPITSLVDTAYVGHLGSAELAAVGVSVAVFNLVSKLLNVPLLNVTTSFVAEEQAVVNKGNEDSSQSSNDCKSDREGKKILPSVSTSLALAAGIGIAEAIALSLGSGSLVTIMGIPVDSPMRIPAENFLTWRAIGAPPIVIALAAQGTFRGFMDTKTPLYAIGAGNILNAILGPILIFSCGLGIVGAAVATVISEYLIAFILLWQLNEKVLLVSPNSIDGRRVVHYMKSGGLLIGRTVAVLITLTLATSLAAKEGSTRMAGHQICVQVWLTISLLTDALALAGQTLLASSYSQGNYEESRQVTYRTLQIGLVTGFSLAVILFFGFETFSSLFTTDSEVLAIARSGILFIAGSQPINAIAFVVDGLYYGVSDFGYASYSMMIVGLISSIFLLVAAPMYGLAGIWAGLFLFMTLRVAAGVWRLGAKRGPWRLVWSEMGGKSE